MKINRFLIGIVTLFFMACVKEEVDNPTFDVQENNITVNAGDSLKFSFKGDANVVTFYSGEPGSIYAYKDRTQKELEGDVTLSFSTRVLNSYELDPRELNIYVSTDFNGNYVYSDIIPEEWENISDRFVFPLVDTGGPLTPAGKVDVSDLFIPGKPFYIAFRYLAIGNPPSPRQGRNWRVEAFSLLNEFTDGSTVLANQVTAGWSLIYDDISKVDPNRGGTVQTVRINFLANNVNREVGIDVWAVSQPIDLFKVEPDRGIAIKNMSQNRMESYAHVYNTPGTYKAVFVAANSNIYGHHSVVKEVNVTVNP